MKQHLRRLSSLRSKPQLKYDVSSWPGNDCRRRRRSKSVASIQSQLPLDTEFAAPAIYKVYYFWYDYVNTLEKQQKILMSLKLWTQIFQISPAIQNALSQHMDSANQILPLCEWLLRTLTGGNAEKFQHRLSKLEIHALDLSRAELLKILGVWHSIMEEFFSDDYTLEVRVSMDILFQLCMHSVNLSSIHETEAITFRIQLQSLEETMSCPVLGRHLYLFMNEALSAELFDFYIEYKKYRCEVFASQRLVIAHDIIARFINPNAADEINLSHTIRKNVLFAYSTQMCQKPPLLPSDLFDGCWKEVFLLIHNNMWRRFKRTMTQLYNGETNEPLSTPRPSVSVSQTQTSLVGIDIALCKLDKSDKSIIARVSSSNNRVVTPFTPSESPTTALYSAALSDPGTPLTINTTISEVDDEKDGGHDLGPARLTFSLSVSSLPQLPESTHNISCREKQFPKESARDSSPPETASLASLSAEHEKRQSLKRCDPASRSASDIVIARKLILA